MKCRTCARRLDLEKLDYTVGCKHEQMEGFICLACAFEGVAYWMTNISEDDYCEEYVPQRTPNAFPTHECVKPTHECVEPVGNSDQLNRTCAECKYYTEEHLCVFWSYFGFNPNDYCSRWEMGW